MLEQADALGLDKPIKLGKVLRIPKLTDEVIFETNRGLPQIRQNYRRLSKAFRQNDKRYAEKSRGLSKSAALQLKLSTEAENLKKVLLFYQLWCHGLFPRANFEDCLRILRAHKSPALKVYRRDLIDAEIRRLKIEKGIIVESSDNDLDAERNEPEPDAEVPNDDGTREESDEDDWGFLSVNRRSTNGLFIGEEDDDEVVTSRPNAVPTNEEVDIDDFDEDDFLPANQDAAEDEHQAELDIMNEMGM